MLPQERVKAVIDGRRPDRIPVYGWVSANLGEPIAQAFGSVAAFEDHYQFDLAHLFGGPPAHDREALQAWHLEHGPELTPGDYLDIPQPDVNADAAYDGLRAAIHHHQTERGRFVYVQTPGIFECLNGVFGIEQHLAYLLLYREELQAVYRRQADWNRSFALNCLDLGIDMVHVSDDWGAQRGLLFSPALWWELIHPAHRVTCEAVRRRGGYLSLHSDGNVNAVLDGIVDLGYQVVHPFQESAGMSLEDYRRDHRKDFAVMGGLDVQTTIGFGRLPGLQREITRVIEMFRDGGLIFCTSHFVQAHCSMDELTFAFDLVYDLVRRDG